jgi:hypothetical protein
LKILPNSQIQSLAFHLDFYFPPYESTEWIFSMDNVNRHPAGGGNDQEGFRDRGRHKPPRSTLPARYIPHEEDLDLILDTLREAHPMLDHFLLSIEGSVTSPPEAETTQHLLDFVYTRHCAEDQSKDAKDEVQYRRHDARIAVLHHDIVRAARRASRYEQAIDAEVMWQMYGAY